MIFVTSQPPHVIASSLDSLSTLRGENPLWFVPRAGVAKHCPLPLWHVNRRPRPSYYYTECSEIPSQMLPVVFAHSVVESKSLHHMYNAIRHTKHFTSFFVSYFSKGPQKILFFVLKASFSIALLLDSSSCCYWYYTPSIWSCPLVRRIRL